MTNEETNLINGLFDRLRTADKAPKDQDAEKLIQEKVSAQPTAPYLMAQTVLVQEQALNNAQARIKDLETRLEQASKDHPQGSGGGFLSNLFGGGGNKNTPPPQQQTQPSYTPAPPPQQQPPYQGGGYAPSYQPAPPQQGGSGGGFLRTALAAAAGVAGGSLLYNGLENMLGHHASTFSGLGGGLGGGGGFLNTGFGGSGPGEVVENHETINNFYGGDDRGDNDRGGGGTVGDFIDNRSDNDKNSFQDNFSTDNPFDGKDDNGNVDSLSGSLLGNDNSNDFASNDDSAFGGNDDNTGDNFDPGSFDDGGSSSDDNSWA